MNDDRQDRPASRQMPEEAKPAMPSGGVDSSDQGPGQKPGQDPETCLTPELREWALQQFTEQEIIAALREVRAKGGVELGAFLKELEQIVTRS